MTQRLVRVTTGGKMAGFVDTAMAALSSTPEDQVGPTATAAATPAATRGVTLYSANTQAITKVIGVAEIVKRRLPEREGRVVVVQQQSEIVDPAEDPAVREHSKGTCLKITLTLAAATA
eukprot:TRINITY_DN41325_c0_g1_i1.p3 TRINITY_DN41325_c0_g1~~TRINITY_DN41325_c0_g1_i1.p3  ORF type:complete len:119 (-),score=31.02 TRINITY_DN41325_c0_g1_i1:111-467(-)